MKKFLLCFFSIVSLSAVSPKAEFYPDIADEEYKNLQEIARYLQSRVRDADAPEDISGTDTNIQVDNTRTNSLPPFDYKLLEQNAENDGGSPVFAVGPNDPRYFEGFKNSMGSQEYNDRPEGDEGIGEEGDVKNLKLSPGETSLNEKSSTVESEDQQVSVTSLREDDNRADIYFTAIVAGCSAAAVVSVIVIGISCYRLHKNAKAAASVDYPAYGVTGPNKDISPTSGDRRLAQSAQMYHYQHQKLQIIAMEGMNNKERRGSISEAESEEENEEGDYTVYECPGLAPTGEMEVKNPLFNDDRTPGNVLKQENEEKEEPSEFPNLISFD